MGTALMNVIWAISECRKDSRKPSGWYWRLLLSARQSMLVATGLLRLRISAANCGGIKQPLQDFVSHRGHPGAAHVAGIVLCSRVYFQDHQISPASKVNLKGITSQSPKRNLQISVAAPLVSLELRLWGATRVICGFLKRFSVISSSPTVRLQAT